MQRAQSPEAGLCVPPPYLPVELAGLWGHGQGNGLHRRKVEIEQGGWCASSTAAGAAGEAMGDCCDVVGMLQITQQENKHCCS